LSEFESVVTLEPRRATQTLPATPSPAADSRSQPGQRSWPDRGENPQVCEMIAVSEDCRSWWSQMALTLVGHRDDLIHPRLRRWALRPHGAAFSLSCTAPTARARATVWEIAQGPDPRRGADLSFRAICDRNLMVASDRPAQPG
jgi:hypothetical protein